MRIWCIIIGYSKIIWEIRNVVFTIINGNFLREIDDVYFRVERARRMMQQRVEAREREEEEKEKQKELERRNLGKNLQEMQRKKEQDLLKEQAKERRKEKEETRLAKEKVQAQIEQDRADRAAR